MIKYLSSLVMTDIEIKSWAQKNKWRNWLAVRNETKFFQQRDDDDVDEEWLANGRRHRHDEQQEHEIKFFSPTLFCVIDISKSSSFNGVFSLCDNEQWMRDKSVRWLRVQINNSRHYEKFFSSPSPSTVHAVIYLINFFIFLLLSLFPSAWPQNSFFFGLIHKLSLWKRKTSLSEPNGITHFDIMMILAILVKKFFSLSCVVTLMRAL